MEDTKKCLVCSDERLSKVHIAAEDAVISCEETVERKKIIVDTAKDLGYTLTDLEVGALEYHIVSGAGIRYLAAALDEEKKP